MQFNFKMGIASNMAEKNVKKKREENAGFQQIPLFLKSFQKAFSPRLLKFPTTDIKD